MRFLVSHVPLVVAGLIAGVFIFIGLGRFFKSSLVSAGGTRFLENPKFLGWGGFFLAIFFLWAFLLPKTYYFPFNNGVVGDDYRYIGSIADGQPNFYQPHHLAFPWLAQKTIRIVEKVKFLSRTDPMYFEKVFSLSALPTKIIIICSLLFLGWGLLLVGFKPVDSLLAILFLGSTAGFLTWGHQVNALGLALAGQTIASTAFLIWNHRRTAGTLALLGFLLSFCMYSHIGTLYFVMAGYMVVTGMLVSERTIPAVRKLQSLLIFNAPIVVLGLIFFYLTAQSAGSYDLKQIFHYMGSTHDAGEFSFRMGRLPKAISDNIVGSIVNILGYWYPNTVGLWLYVIGFQIAVATALVISLARNLPQVLADSRKLLFFFLTSLIIFLCFIPWRTGTHYYVVATVPNVLLLAILFLAKSSSEADVLRRRTLVALLVVAMIGFTGFSTENVFKGSALNDRESYRIDQQIFTQLAPGEKAVYYRPFDSDYADSGIRQYYSGKFHAIKWVNNPAEWSHPEQLIPTLSGLLGDAQVKVFLGEEVLKTLLPVVSKIKTEQISNDVYRLVEI